MLHYRMKNLDELHNLTQLGDSESQSVGTISWPTLNAVSILYVQGICND
jgi:hypothetical protein